MVNIEKLQNELQQQLDKYKAGEKEFHKLISQKQLLDGQYQETDVVKQELNLLKPGCQIYKLIGPVLVKQDLEESKMNVAKRVAYISGELKRTNEMILSLEAKQEKQRDKLSKMQAQLQQEQTKVVLAS